MSSEYQRLAERLRTTNPLFVLSGAGLSTDSGIPDYRDDRGEYRRGPPMQFRTFRDKLEASIVEVLPAAVQSLDAA